MPPSIDPRNAGILVYIDGDLYPREEARISVFDSVVQGGDAVWEGVRIYDGGVGELEGHLDRLFASAHAMAFTGMPTRDYVRNAIFRTLKANGMRDGAWIRLTLTRGKKITSGMTTKHNQFGPTLIVLAEWKTPIYASDGIRLITSAIRRNPPECIDSKIHHNNLINNILAKIQAELAGVDDAVMLDLNGFVSETNATNIFVVKKGELITPHPDSCLPGITRARVIQLAREEGIVVTERNISLTEVYNADEAFTTGTVGELSPVIEVDGRRIGSAECGPVTARLQVCHARYIREHAVPIPD